MSNLTTNNQNLLAQLTAETRRTMIEAGQFNDFVLKLGFLPVWEECELGRTKMPRVTIRITTVNCEFELMYMYSGFWSLTELNTSWQIEDASIEMVMSEVVRLLN